MESKLICGSSVSAIENCLQEAIGSTFSPTLAIVFGSLTCEIESLPTIFTKRNIKLFGASSAGEFTGENISAEGIVVLLLDMNPDAFRIFQIEADYTNSFVAGKKLAQFSKSHFDDPSFILLFSMNINGEGLISGINDELERTPSIYGGMAGDNLKMESTYSFSNSHFSNSSVTALILDNTKIEVKGLALCGWQPIGVEHQITKAKDNVIYSINNQPALNVVKQYFGDYYNNSLEEDTVTMGAAQYPLQLNKANTSVLRAALIANEDDGSLLMAGPVKEGDYFQFSVAPGFEVIEETIRGFREYKENHQEVDALILFSCKARHMSLGPLVEDEVTGIYDIWKKPLIGFFTYGEIGQHGTGLSYFYNETCSLVLLRERKT